MIFICCDDVPRGLSSLAVGVSGSRRWGASAVHVGGDALGDGALTVHLLSLPGVHVITLPPFDSAYRMVP